MKIAKKTAPFVAFLLSLFLLMSSAFALSSDDLRITLKKIEKGSDGVTLSLVFDNATDHDFSIGWVNSGSIKVETTVGVYAAEFSVFDHITPGHKELNYDVPGCTGDIVSITFVDLRVLNDRGLPQSKIGNWYVDGISEASVVTGMYGQTAPTADVPSDWAVQEVNAALSQGLIPDVLQCRYTENITREEFCALMVQLLEKETESNVFTFLTENDLTLSDPFTDTDNVNVLAAYALGIVSGKSSTTFDPAASITRAEAAAMLTRTAKVLKLTEPEDGLTFADADTFDDWAKSGIAFVSGLTDPSSHNRVMGGVGDGLFLPLGVYTRQQAFITALRLYNCVNENTDSTTTKNDTSTVTSTSKVTEPNEVIETTTPGTDSTIDTGKTNEFETDHTTKENQTTKSDTVSTVTGSLLTNSYYETIPENEPATVEIWGEDLVPLLEYMMSHGVSSVMITYPKQYSYEGGFRAFSDAMGNNISYAYDIAERNYPEHASFFKGTNINSTYRPVPDNEEAFEDYCATISLHLCEDLTERELKKQIRQMEQECDEIINTLQTEGKLRSGMSDKEMAEVLFKYTIARLSYENDYHTSLYQVLETDSAVCEGYTYLFNALCHRVGIPMKYASGTRGGPHAWASIEVDGITYYTDPTWGESYSNAQIEEMVQQFRESSSTYTDYLINSKEYTDEQVNEYYLNEVLKKLSDYWDEEWQCCFDMSEFWVAQD